MSCHILHLIYGQVRSLTQLMVSFGWKGESEVCIPLDGKYNLVMGPRIFRLIGCEDVTQYCPNHPTHLSIYHATVWFIMSQRTPVFPLWIVTECNSGVICGRCCHRSKLSLHLRLPSVIHSPKVIELCVWRLRAMALNDVLDRYYFCCSLLQVATNLRQQTIKDDVRFPVWSWWQTVSQKRH